MRSGGRFPFLSDDEEKLDRMRRFVRRMVLASLAETFPCTECGAKPWKGCREGDGSPSRHYHEARIKAAIEKFRATESG